MNHGSYRCDKLSHRRSREGLSINFDNARQGKRHVEHAYPCIGLVLYVIRYRTFIRIHAHEQLTRFCELHDVFPVMSDELLHGIVMAEVS